MGFTLSLYLLDAGNSTGGIMSTQAHLEALKTKHKVLEADLADALLHSSSRDQELAAIKHRKLLIKDEITSIETKLRTAG
jgi:hypothetical protein